MSLVHLQERYRGHHGEEGEEHLNQPRNPAWLIVRIFSAEIPKGHSSTLRQAFKRG
jgi:hypothetical protein